MYCILSFVRPLIPTKLAPEKVKENSCTSTATCAYDSTTIASTETR